MNHEGENYTSGPYATAEEVCPPADCQLPQVLPPTSSCRICFPILFRTQSFAHLLPSASIYRCVSRLYRLPEHTTSRLRSSRAQQQFSASPAGHHLHLTPFQDPLRCPSCRPSRPSPSNTGARAPASNWLLFSLDLAGPLG